MDMSGGYKDMLRHTPGATPGTREECGPDPHADPEQNRPILIPHDGNGMVRFSIPPLPSGGVHSSRPGIRRRSQAM